MFLICVLFAYPLEHFSCTNTITKLMYGEWGQPPFALGYVLTQGKNLGIHTHATYKHRSHIHCTHTTLRLGIKLALVAFTTVPALFISDIGPLISWAG